MKARFQIAICFALVISAFAQTTPAPKVSVDERASSVLLRDNTYTVTLVASYSAPLAPVSLRLEILDPADHVLARSESTAQLRPGTNRLSSSFTLSPPPKQTVAPVWYRLAYKLIGAQGDVIAEGVMPLFTSVDDFALHVSAPNVIQPGKKFFVRVHTTHPVLTTAAPGVTVAVRLRPSGDDTSFVSASARTDARGYAVIPMTLPATSHEHELEVAVRAQRGGIKKSAETDIRVGAPTRILVQTDKPLYQPGQTLHIRAIAFGDEHRALAGKKLYLQVEDEDDTVVFREQRTSSRFGVVSADWTIPDRVKLGDYRIIAKTYAGRNAADDDDDDDDPISASAERTVVRISRYDLPTFVVNAKPDRAFYLPDQDASVEISASYLFGKPVPQAKVRLSRLEERHWNYKKQRWDVDEEETLEGVSDKDGLYRAKLDLSDEHAELDDRSYSRFRDITYTAYVTDPSTGRTEQRRFDVRITKYPIHVYYVGQGSYRRGISDDFFLSTSYADGTTAECSVEIRTIARDGSGERIVATAHTNRYGVARIRSAKALLTTDGHELPLIIVARDRKGATGATKETLWEGNDEPFLRVVTQKTVLAPGEPIEAMIESDINGEVVVELTSQSKVLRGFTARVKGHRAFIRIPYSDEFTGRIAITAVNMEGRSNWYRYGLTGARWVIYPKNPDLKLTLRMDKDEYRPGQPASATVQVSTPAGAAIPGAIGAVIFDKAVEERARIDQDLSRSFGFGGYESWWYYGEAHLANLTSADLDRIDTSRPIPEDLDLAADFILNGSSGRWYSYPQVFGDQYERESPQQVYRSLIDRTLKPALDAIDKEHRTSLTLPRNRQQLDELLTRHDLHWSDLRDPWGSEFVVEFGLGRNTYNLTIGSNGPDKRTDTDDDFQAAARYVSFYGATQAQITRAIQEYHAITGEFVRDTSSLAKALAAVGVDLSTLRDPWGHPYLFSFGIAGTQYTVVAKSLGESAKPGEEYEVGTSGVDYFAESRIAIDQILVRKTQQAGKLPDTPEQVKDLLLPEFRFDELRDPFGRPYVIRITNDARYSDRFSRNNDRVDNEPVTTWIRHINIRSAGEDGVPDSPDDFTLATFSTTLSQVTVDGKTSAPAIHALFTGNTGGIAGVVTDQTGAVIPNVKVVATNAYNNLEYQTTTDSQGSYLLRDLPPGLYDLTIQSSGFLITKMTNLVVRAQEAISVNATLRLGAASETVEVAAVSELTNTSSAMVQTLSKTASTDLSQQATVTPRLREYFPETLLWQPSIETDARGRARFNWKFADNLTTWKVSLIASTLDGRLATVEKEVKSFQPFFVEHDPPKVLTIGDRISLPVVVRNYTSKTATVKVEMPAADWFHAASTTPQQSSIAPGANAKLIFPFEATACVAQGKQRVIAAGAAVADAIERPVAVHPDGAELTRSDGRIISGDSRFTLDIPSDAIASSVHVDLKLYPDLVAHVTESIEGMMRRPYGCGEQTISSTYPSIMMLQFESRTKRSLGPLHDRAMRYASQGYTRLLTYADDSGAFTYWGHGEPDIALTAYAVRFLRDASPIIPVDATVLDRARQWLFRQQKPDGSWIAHRWYRSDPVEDAILTAYIARILASTAPPASENKNASVEQAAIRRALDYVAVATTNYSDPYLFAGYGLAALAAGEPARAAAMLPKLRTSAQSQRSGAFWELRTNTPFYGWGHAGAVETTALAVQLLQRTGHSEDATLIDRGLTYLIEQKDRYGTWYSTQTTVNVIDALLLLASRPAPATATPLRVVVNGSPQQLPAATNSFALQLVNISSHVHPGKNTIEIAGGAAGVATAQTVAYYYVPWSSPLAVPAPGPIKLNVKCDRTHLDVGEKATCEASTERVGSRGHGMMIAEIGLPPGVDVDREALQKQLSEGGWDLSSFEVLPDRVIAYVWPRAGGMELSISFTARMAIDALAAPHSLFDYYNPDASVAVAPDRFIIGDIPKPATQEAAAKGH